MRDGVVRVWWAEVRDLGAADHDLLDATERARLVRLKREEDRDRFVLGAALVRRLVADMEGVEAASVALDRACPRCGAQHGPVSAPGRRWRCSVAHAGSLAVAAVALTPVGVDLEVSCPPDWRSLVKEVVAPGEPEPVDQAGFPEHLGAQGGCREGHPRGAPALAHHRGPLGPPAGLRVLDLDVPGATAALARTRRHRETAAGRRTSVATGRR